MNFPDPPPETDPVFRESLQSWSVETSAPPDFRRMVWQRIAVCDGSRTSWLLNLRDFSELFVRPVVAGVAAVIVLGISILGARVHSEIAANQTMRQLSEQYVVSIDPLLRSQFEHQSR